MSAKTKTPYHGEARKCDDALQEIRHKLDGKAVDPHKVHPLIRILGTIIENGEGLAKQVPHLIAAVDKATSSRYPHHKPWDHATRARLLAEEQTLLGQIALDGVIAKSDLEYSVEFCRAMRDALHEAERKHTTKNVRH
jgi:hypothetical protein